MDLLVVHLNMALANICYEPRNAFPMGSLLIDLGVLLKLVDNSKEIVEFG